MHRQHRTGSRKGRAICGSISPTIMSNKVRDGHSSPGQQPQINSAESRSQSWTVLLHPELVAGEEGTGVTDRGCGNRNRHLLSTTAAAELVTTGQTQADAQDYKRLLNPGLQDSSDLPLRPRGQQAYKYEFTSLKQWQS